MAGRIGNQKFLDKVMSADDAAAFIEPGDSIGFSGFTGAGYPKEVPGALARRIKAATDRGEEFKVRVFTGASTAPELDGVLAETNNMAFRTPYQSDPSLRKVINNGTTDYCDIHLSHLSKMINLGYMGDIDVAVVEATLITEDGKVVPTSSVGMSRTYLARAKKIIIEVNEWQTEDLYGMHDIYYGIGQVPPNTPPIPITAPGDLIGEKAFTIDTDKVVAVVKTNDPDRNSPFKPLDDDSKKIAGYLLDLFDHEVRHGRMPANLFPLQSGVGNIANAVLAGLLDSKYENMTSYTEVIQDGMVNLIDAGKISVASATSFSLSPDAAHHMNENASDYRGKIILRPQDVSNHPEVIRRLGVISCNGMIEADIFGNVNSTHISGTRMVNGIGGSGDFTRSASLSIFVSPSTAKDGAISTIVPMVSHVDHTEHDVMVIITEYGVADLRGLSPRRRPEVIIDNCAHPDYRAALHEYYDRALKTTKAIHTPMDLDNAFSFHQRLRDTGTMMPS